MAALQDFAEPSLADRLTARDYEDVTADLIQVLAEQQDLETLELATRARVKGKSTTNEVDVWWRFLWNGQEKRMAFQCKKKGRPIDQGEVFKMLGVLQDLGDDVGGMMVTHLGYTAGALRVAKHYEIGTLELRRPLESDWAGRFRDLEVHIQLVSGHLSALAIFRKDGSRLTHVRHHPLYFVKDFADEFHVVAPDGQRKSLARTVSALAPRLEDIHEPVSVVVDLEEETMLFAPNDPVPVEVSRIEATLLVARPSSSFVSRGDDVVRLVLRDALGGDTVTFDRRGRPYQNVSFPFTSRDDEQPASTSPATAEGSSTSSRS